MGANQEEGPQQEPNPLGTLSAPGLGDMFLAQATQSMASGRAAQTDEDGWGNDGFSSNM